MLVIHASGCEDRHFYFFLLLMEPSISQSHRLSLGFGLADNKPPFSLTFHRPLGNRPGSMGTGHKQKIPLLGPTHLGWFFFFSHQSHEAFGGPGSWASSAFVGRPPCSLIASALLTRSLHVLSALYALHIYENLSLPPTELTV